MRKIITVAAVVAASLLSAPASAQSRTGVVLRPDDSHRWDASGLISWAGVNASDIGAPWDQWYGAADFGATAGRYLTPHVKIEFDAATSTEGHVYGKTVSVSVPGIPVPVIRSSDYFLRSTGIGAIATYQFFDNLWFHPYVGGGIAFTRESRRSQDSRDLYYPTSDPRSPLFVPPRPPETSVTYRGSPLATVGFKWYLSERTFFRTEVRTLLSTSPLEGVAWRTGFGVDF